MAETDRYVKVMHNVALVCVVTCPLVMLLPPRKLGFSTIMLGGMTTYSANFLVRERTGKSLWQTISPQSRQRAENAQIWSAQEGVRQQRQDAILPKDEALTASLGSQDRPDDWKSRRDEEVKEALEDGKGIGDMIYDQIWEVVSWGKKADDDN
ncbi:hypothetical protein K431DRAFT_304412 [Polychaeton citri CBS 116435]|uniref:Uncharacterized protein n=1 Tax=Polychaeton citri CBS 116435 TaxID=1314669 RepID=A0A9P4Q8Q1_9PEZI|nr:hypothetical protein K431DRAFT_304412 [Polychaeton citri CBS 116435]